MKKGGNSPLFLGPSSKISEGYTSRCLSSRSIPALQAKGKGDDEQVWNRMVVVFLGCLSILGIAEFIVPTGFFFHAQTHISFHVIEELSPNVRMILYDDPLS
jgi:hypothetical protein